MTRTSLVPKHVFLETTIECNLRCVQCDIYTLTNPPDELTLEDRRSVVRQVGAWDPTIRIVLSGGEPFVRRKMLFDVAEACRESAVYTTISTNGTLVTEEDAERLPHSGIRCVVVSLDSDEAAVHDQIRGVPRTFERAVRTVRRLVAARERARTDFTVLTSTIIGRHNLARVPQMLNFFEGLGVDTTLFQPIQPVFAREVEVRWWKDAPLFPGDAEMIDRGIDELIRLKAMGRRLFQTTEQFQDMRWYFHHPGNLAAGQCAAMDRHLMVDMLGNIRLCFHMHRMGLPPIGHVRTHNLRRLWEDEHTESVRGRMRLCREGCGSMICHAR